MTTNATLPSRADPTLILRALPAACSPDDSEVYARDCEDGLRVTYLPTAPGSKAGIIRLLDGGANPISKAPKCPHLLRDRVARDVPAKNKIGEILIKQSRPYALSSPWFFPNQEASLIVLQRSPSLRLFFSSGVHVKLDPEKNKSLGLLEAVDSEGYKLAFGLGLAS